VAEGERADVERFLDFLRHGPRAARVSDVQASWEPASDEFRRFDVRF
jgi:acylphosphatase